MDDKTKVQLCRQLIENFWGTREDKVAELPVILNDVETVLKFEEENDG